MIRNIPTIERIFKQLQHVPYLASKNVYRVLDYFLNMSPEDRQAFADTLEALNTHVSICDTCCAWKEAGQACLLCDDGTRDKRVVCVVAKWYDIFAIERSNTFSGTYHILGGLICPLEGVGPEDLSIDRLVQRVTNHNVSEVILALSQTPEGEATSSYIAQQLAQTGVTVTCLARGVPVGSSLEHTDQLTLQKALSERVRF